MGTAAHGLLEAILRKASDMHDDPDGQQTWVFAPARDWLGRVIRLVGEDEKASILKPGAECKDGDFEVDEDMADAVQVHVDYVQQRLEEMGPDAELIAECKVEVPEVGFGTSDTILSSWPELLESIDYKHGAGVIVEVEANDQLLYYLLGKAIEDGFTHRMYRATVVQPRAEHADGYVRSYDINREDLKAFYEELKKDARKTERKNAPLSAGEWCRFCPAAGDCPELRSQAELAAQADFAQEPEEISLPDEAHGTLDSATAGRLMRWVDITDAWGKAVRKRIAQMLMSGQAVDDWKLVRGKDGNRRWKENEEGIRLGLAESFPELDEDDVAPRKLRSPAQMEKLKVPKDQKKKLKDAIADLVERPPGKITVAPASDPRPAITAAEAAAADFANADTDAEDF